MTSECSINQQRIPRSFVGDLAEEELRALELHMADCLPCRAEHERYGETLQMLRSAGDEPVPRHFFVYPQEHASNPWQIFRQMMPRWQAATALVVLAFLTVGIAAASGLQVRKDSGSWALSFGIGRSEAPIDINALKADILRTAEERNREFAIGYIQTLRSEITGSRLDLTQQQQVQLAAAFSSLESRLGQRIDAAAENVRAGSQKTAIDLYQTVSAQQTQDMNAVNTRIDKVADAVDTKARQTDTILETLLQVANLNLKQPGDPK